MFNWLYEGRASVYVAIAAIGLAFLMAWYRNQKKKWLWGGVAAAAIFAIAYAFLDRAVQTDEEQVKGRIQEMTAAASRNDMDTAFRYISEQFQSPGGRNKSTFKEFAKRHRNSNEVTDIVVSQFEVLQPPNPDSRKGKISFTVKVYGEAGRGLVLFAHCEAEVELHPSEGWQLRRYALFDPLKNDEAIPSP